jgi:hypothetical protein
MKRYNTDQIKDILNSNALTDSQKIDRLYILGLNDDEIFKYAIDPKMMY